MKPIITTIITTFRRPTLLKRAINSILSQTYPHFQILVFDNASGDETDAVMAEFVNSDHRIKYHRHIQNIGMMKNYEFAFSKIDTPYFSFLSDDDYFSPWFYETAIKDLEQYPNAGFSVCSVQVINDEEQLLFNSHCLWGKKGYFPAPEGFLEMLSPIFKPPIPTCTLFNRKIIEGILPDLSEEIQLLWDPNYFLQLAAQFPFVVNEKPCGFFLAHNDGFSSGFYNRLQNSPQEMEIYLKAGSRLIQGIMENKHLLKETKLQAKELINGSFKEHIDHRIRAYVKEKKYSNAFYSIKLRSHYLDTDKFILASSFKYTLKLFHEWLKNKIPLLKTFL